MILDYVASLRSAPPADELLVRSRSGANRPIGNDTLFWYLRGGYGARELTSSSSMKAMALVLVSQTTNTKMLRTVILPSKLHQLRSLQLGDSKIAID